MKRPMNRSAAGRVPLAATPLFFRKLT